jgi:hypothetical protein
MARMMKEGENGPGRTSEQRDNKLIIKNIRVRENKDSDRIIIDRLVFILDERFKDVDLGPVLDWITQGLAVAWASRVRPLGSKAILEMEGSEIDAKDNVALSAFYGKTARVPKPPKDSDLAAVFAFKQSGDKSALKGLDPAFLKALADSLNDLEEEE